MPGALSREGRREAKGLRAHRQEPGLYLSPSLLRAKHCAGGWGLNEVYVLVSDLSKVTIHLERDKEDGGSKLH